MYLYPYSAQHLSAGFTVLLDAHSSKTHSSSKHLLEKLAVSEHALVLVRLSGVCGR